MTDSFAVSARQIGAQMSVLLGWTPDQFWSATPEELYGIFVALERAGLPGRPSAPLDRLSLEKLRKDCPDG